MERRRLSNRVARTGSGERKIDKVFTKYFEDAIRQDLDKKTGSGYGFQESRKMEALMFSKSDFIFQPTDKMDTTFYTRKPQAQEPGQSSIVRGLK